MEETSRNFLEKEEEIKKLNPLLNLVHLYKRASIHRYYG